ncbi:hypothetical protein [Dielma fastidiosa]|uniref:Uncharacterized protein n=1 Tax=Dielma fastidiosa TaxID=1034346 RepID=A0A318L179_9FIRM|nr:hypothetical protein [Dielma fastidiosa]PXX81696.1 hypothetical protein DES51_101308 [Dielma fastidiosa]
MKVKEFDLGSIHVEFYDDNCVDRDKSEAIYKGFAKYLFYINKECQALNTKKEQGDNY